MNTWLIVLLVLSSIAAIAILCAVALSRSSNSDSDLMAEEPLQSDASASESDVRAPDLSTP